MPPPPRLSAPRPCPPRQRSRPRRVRMPTPARALHLAKAARRSISVSSAAAPATARLGLAPPRLTESRAAAIRRVPGSSVCVARSKARAMVRQLSPKNAARSPVLPTMFVATTTPSSPPGAAPPAAAPRRQAADISGRRPRAREPLASAPTRAVLSSTGKPAREMMIAPPAPVAPLLVRVTSVAHNPAAPIKSVETTARGASSRPCARMARNVAPGPASSAVPAASGRPSASAALWVATRPSGVAAGALANLAPALQSAARGRAGKRRMVPASAARRLATLLAESAPVRARRASSWRMTTLAASSLAPATAPAVTTRRA